MELERVSFKRIFFDKEGHFKTFDLSLALIISGSLAFIVLQLANPSWWVSLKHYTITHIAPGLDCKIPGLGMPAWELILGSIDSAATLSIAIPYIREKIKTNKTNKAKSDQNSA